MSVVFRGMKLFRKFAGQSPAYVTDGLILNLDASNASSYPGSGETWTDLSGNGNHATLSGTSYSTDKGGALYFDPTNQAYGYMDFVNPQAETVMVWARSPFNYWNAVGWLSSSRQVNGHIIHPDNGGAVTFWMLDENASYAYIGPVSPEDVSIPHLYCFTTNGSNSHKIYLDGGFISEDTTGITRTASPTAVPYWFGCDQTESRYGNGYIYHIMRYNKVLSDSEILQNYNATKARFI